MALTPKQELRQSQTLVMTPQLQQAIKLLQLSNLELAAYVEQELERNPLLEHQEPERDEAEPGGGEEAAAGSEGGGEAGDRAAGDAEVTPPDSAQLSDRETMPADNDAPLDVDYATAYGGEEPVAAPASPEAGYDANYAGGQPAGRGGSHTFDDGGFEQSLSRAISLREHLTGQLNVDVVDPVDRLIGANLIDLLDDAGYLTGDLESIAERVGCELTRVEDTLAKLQEFDPPGVLARNLAECLALQLKDRDRLDPAMATLLEHLDLVAHRDTNALVKLCGLDTDDIDDMLAEIRTLNPKPGLAFHNETIQTVTPDVFVRPATDGGWHIELNSDTLPRLLVNRTYYGRINGLAKSQADKTYITEQFQSASWLLKSLDQRANTILKVATELVAQQDRFLTHGVDHLRPLNLRDIAQVIEMHESTVSRVTSNKYIATPRGIYPMKYFFTSAIPSSAGGEAHSAESVRHRIRDLIDNESPGAVLSDDKIVEILHSASIEIARRTVAKYREAMRIPSSVDRRWQKKQSATR